MKIYGNAIRPGMTIEHQDRLWRAIRIQLPGSVALEVTEADAVVKVQMASSSYKPAILENGLRALVPPFIEARTRMVASTTDGTYIERAKD
jgi:elongation factor P